jgi:hypothetical protein
MHFWPVADEPRQLSLLAERVLSLVKAGAASPNLLSDESSRITACRAC